MQGFGVLLASLALAALFGGMVFFGTVMAPLVFAKLPSETAGMFIRVAFPRYYFYVSITSVLAAIGLWLRGAPALAILPALVLAVTLWLWIQWLPHLNALRDAGDQVAFARGHRLSVLVNVGQLVVVAISLIVVAFR